MRIVCTVTNDLAQDQRMERICNSLRAVGHEVTLVGRRLPTSKPLVDRPYRQHRIFCEHTQGKRFYAEYNYRLWRVLRKWDYDAICSVDLDTLLPGYLLTRGGRARLVYDAHEWFSETPEVVARPRVQWIWRRLGRWLVPKTDLRYTVAPVLAGLLEEDYGMGFGVVRNLPRRAEKRNRPRDPRPPGANVDSDLRARPHTLLYQGMLNPGRGLEAAIHALARLPTCQLDIVGDGPERPDLEALARQLGLTDRITFHGFVSPDRLPEYTNRAWLGLNLFDGDSPNYYYSLANKALDYLQAHLPSVQMDFPEYRAINHEFDCYLLVENLDHEQLAKKIAALLTDEKRYAGLRKNCERAASVLNWEEEEKRLLAYWAGLTGPKKPGR